jgi:hypothetical protein
MVGHTVRFRATILLTVLGAIVGAFLGAMPYLTRTAEAAGTDDNQGFLYGRITTDSGGEYVGFLRWGDEESFWDDLFHSTKEELPYWEYVDEDERPQSDDVGLEDIPVLRWFVKIKKDGWSASRIFICRFGDIRDIRPRADDAADVRLKNGETYKVSGYSNDVGGKIHISDRDTGEMDLHWGRIASIEFLPAPAGEDPGVSRLYGAVETDMGSFEGYIQWDKQECLDTDRLDGDSRDGDVSVKMGDIRSIKRSGRSSSIVTLKDGREMRLRGSNDVNHENRGIMIEDSRYGRVTVGWGAFDRITFADPPGSGRGYADYPPLGRLSGAVTVRDGQTHRGRIVFDIDESEGWEMLNGSHREVEFDLLFASISVIEPRGPDSSLIFMRNGQELTLEDSQDVSDRNDGVLVLADQAEDNVYIPWGDVASIHFDP